MAECNKVEFLALSPFLAGQAVVISFLSSRVKVQSCFFKFENHNLWSCMLSTMYIGAVTW